MMIDRCEGTAVYVPRDKTAPTMFERIQGILAEDGRPLDREEITRRLERQGFPFRNPRFEARVQSVGQELRKMRRHGDLTLVGDGWVLAARTKTA